MSTLQYVVKVSRPGQSLIAALAAFTVALLSNGPLWFTEAKLAAAGTIFFSVVGASVFHYGARYDVYAKKYWDPVDVRNPFRHLLYGAWGFGASICIAALFLPWPCAVLAIANAITILLYARRLDKIWPWKNIVIAFICTTPLLIGWLSGHRLHPIVPPMMLSAFFIYLAREMLKDIKDRTANHGTRFTMVMDIGVTASLKVAGMFLGAALAVLLLAAEYVATVSLLALGFYILGAAVLTYNTFVLLCGRDITDNYQRIDLAVVSYLLCLLIVRFYAW